LCDGADLPWYHFPQSLHCMLKAKLLNLPEGMGSVATDAVLVLCSTHFIIICHFQSCKRHSGISAHHLKFQSHSFYKYFECVNTQMNGLTGMFVVLKTWLSTLLFFVGKQSSANFCNKTSGSSLSANVKASDLSTTWEQDKFSSVYACTFFDMSD